MKAYQIVIKDNEISEAYAKISRESFEPLISAGIIDEIITFDAITPQSENFEEHIEKYQWNRSLMAADVLGQKPQDHSPTEKAGMCSHWELMRMASESDERFFVLEHDTYFLSEHFDIFAKLVEQIKREDTLYANLGLFMGCYSIAKQPAEWMYEVLTYGEQFNSRFPINCGPYCTLSRLFGTYTQFWLKPNNYNDIPDGVSTVIHPWHHCDTLYTGRKVEVPFNTPDENKILNPLRNPTTQVISKSMSVTQHHHGYRQDKQDMPWTRHSYFHVID